MYSGLGGAQSTLTSQAFGSGQLELCGVYLNRGRIIQIVFSMPAYLILSIFGEQIMILIGQEKDVAQIAGIYLVWILPGYVLLGLNNMTNLWLSSMRLTFVSVYVGIFNSFGYIPIVAFFVKSMDADIRSFGISLFV